MEDGDGSCGYGPAAEHWKKDVSTKSCSVTETSGRCCGSIATEGEPLPVMVDGRTKDSIRD